MILSPEQLRAAMDIDRGKNVFLSGNAGTGKSTVVGHVLENLDERRGVAVVATTGIAAINLRDQFAAKYPKSRPLRVTTIYSWAGIGIGPAQGEHVDAFVGRMADQAQRTPHMWRNLRNTHMVIIDEVSMLPGKVLDAIDRIARLARNDTRPFGGMQVVAVGDFLQLPPVSKNGVYDWAFKSAAWRELKFIPHILKTVHRQSDPEFVSLLNAVRTGRIGKEHEALLRSRVPTFPRQDILRLFTHNAQVDKWNNMMLDGIESPEVEHKMTTRGDPYAVEKLRKNLIVQDVVKLKKGARVMVLANIRGDDGELALVNGSLATVVDPSTPTIIADGTTEIVALERYGWVEDMDPMINTATVTQVPLRLAWASTIHKSQGLSLDSALIDVRAAREPGQAYVALSRVKKISGMYLKDMFSIIYTSQDAAKFMAAPY
jgi:hypothetical protein